MHEYILEMDNITKQFPGVLALDQVQLKVRKGTVHALMGENGAGKSTLMKAIIGIQPPDEGTIIYKGKEVKIPDAKTALNLGISMIHQELSPIPYMTVAENIFLGREPIINNTGFVNKKKMIKDTEQLLAHLGIEINPHLKMKELSIANTQVVEIAKAISYNSDLIIMDEPTSAITDQEVAHLFRIIRELRASGVSIIYITHKMDEVYQICDEITVFRDGKYVGTESAEKLDKDEMIRMMVGRDLKQIFHKEIVEIGDEILSVNGLSREGKFQNVSFKVNKGEIIGLAGLMGAGRTEVIESVFGIYPADSGSITINGKEISIKSPRDAISHRMALLTEDRKKTGCFLGLTVKDNIIIANLKQFVKGRFLDKSKIIRICLEEKEKFKIKTPSVNQLLRNLSGGNQQKVLVSRWLLTDPDILILDEPTRGIDVGAKAEIHKLMSQLASMGKAVIMVSSELPEVLGMSDRIYVMHEGKISGEVKREFATQEVIMRYATGSHG